MQTQGMCHRLKIVEDGKKYHADTAPLSGAARSIKVGKVDRWCNVQDGKIKTVHFSNF